MATALHEQEWMMQMKCWVFSIAPLTQSGVNSDIFQESAKVSATKQIVQKLQNSQNPELTTKHEQTPHFLFFTAHTRDWEKWYTLKSYLLQLGVSREVTAHEYVCFIPL